MMKFKADIKELELKFLENLDYSNSNFMSLPEDVIGD